MEARSIFQNISPIDHRYSISEKALFDALSVWISEEASIASCVKAEIALVIAHLSVRGGLTPALKSVLLAAEISRSTVELVLKGERNRCK